MVDNSRLFPRNLQRFLTIGVLLTALLLSAGPLSAEIVDFKIDRLQFPKIKCRFRVLDTSGQPVTSLTDKDFTLLEDTLSGASRVKGAQWTLPGQVPLSIAIVLDYSGSMLQPASPGDPTPKWQAAKKIALELVDYFQPGDRALVETFTTSHKDKLLIPIICGPTSETRKLHDAIEQLGPPEEDGATPICDALQTAIYPLARENGKRIIFLLTDGQDNAANVPGSFTDFDVPIKQANRADIEIDSFGYGDPNQPDLHHKEGLDTALLQRLATGTRGKIRASNQEQDLADFFRKRAQERREEYEVVFDTSRSKEDGTNRRVTITNDAYGRKRKNYQAPGAVPAEFDRASAISAIVGLILIVICIWPTWRSLGRPVAPKIEKGDVSP